MQQKYRRLEIIVHYATKQHISDILKCNEEYFVGVKEYLLSILHILVKARHLQSHVQ